MREIAAAQLPLHGHSSASRMPGRLLTAGGLEELEAPTPEAKSLPPWPGDPARYRSVRDRLAGVWSGILGDVALFSPVDSKRRWRP